MAVRMKPHGLRARLQALAGLGFLGGLLVFALWPWLPGIGRAEAPHTIVFYGFSILGETMNTAVLPAFQADWARQSGEHVEFATSFAGSGTITNQILMGVPADLALLSLELDAQRLADAGVVEAGSWRRLPHQGTVNRTPFIILVRPGNPKGIHDFADLAKPGVGVVHPDPLTSGGANWAILAEYGAGVRSNPDDPEAGYRLLLGIWRNVVAQAPSARAARTQFENGFGDALVTYEQEALADLAGGRLRSQIVFPQHTILSEHTLVVIQHHVAPEERARVEALQAFLWSDAAQRLFVEHGFRSVDERLNRENDAFGAVADPFTVADLGGWERAKREIVDAVWKDRVLKELGR